MKTGLSLLFLTWLCCASVGLAAGERPNIVFIFIDDMGYGDLSCTGNTDVETPNIDKLAADGLLLTNFYVGSPICSPSRVAITTGQYPARSLINSYLNNRARNRVRGMADFLDPKRPAIARAFQQGGYATAHFGKWHMGGGRDVGDAPLPSAYGFDESLVSFEGLGDRILPEGNGLAKQSEALGRGKIRWVQQHEQTGIYVDRAIDFVEQHKSEPIYLHLWLNDVHDAHRPAPEQLAKFEKFSANPYEQKFYAVLVEMDRQIGRLIDAIDEKGLGENTLIVLTSDNGATAWPRYYDEGYEPPGSSGGFRGRKWSLYEGGIRMPLIARWTGRITAGREDRETIMGAVDFFPTFCAVAGINPPKGVEFDGVDMSRALLHGPVTRTKPLFWEYGRDRSYLRPGAFHDRSPNLAMREGPWKFLINADGSHPELYHLQDDPAETENLVAAHPAVASSMEERLLKWRRSLPELKAAPRRKPVTLQKK